MVVKRQQTAWWHPQKRCLHSDEEGNGKPPHYNFPSIVKMAIQDDEHRSTDHGPRIPRSGRGRVCRASQVVIQRNPCTKDISKNIETIGTWNVRTMYQAGKTHNVIQEMDRLNVGILGNSEMRWTGTGECNIEKHKIYYSGHITDHQYGVGVIVNEKLSKYVSNFIPVSERILLLQINTKPIKLNIVQIYAPTLDKTEEEIEEFYESLTDLLAKLNKTEIIILMGDFNAKIGEGKSGEHIGSHGLGTRNERGDRLHSFAEEQEMVIMNTFFKLPPRRLCTWISPADTPDHLVRNQIDFLLINKRFRNSCLSTKTYPGADAGSDHNPLIGKFRLKLKKIEKHKENKRSDLRMLKDGRTEEQVRQHIKQELDKEGSNNNIEHEIEVFEKTMNTTKIYLTQKTTIKRKPWMTDHILSLMEERRQAKQNSKTKYNNLHRQIRTEIGHAKERWMNEKCEEIERLEARHDYFNMYKRVKEAAGIYKPKASGILVDEQNKIITEKQAMMNTWQKYVEELFGDERPEDIPPPEGATGPSITFEEVRNVISLIKGEKAPGPDEIHGELLKLLEEDGIHRLTKLFNNIYNSGQIPKSWLRSTFIPLPKKANARHCNEYRTISLMSHLLKVFLKIIHQRLYPLCEQRMGSTQFGFRKALGTREALFTIQVLFQRCRDVNCSVYVCFIDFQKAFDRVQHHKLIDVLKQIGIDTRDLRIIQNLYWNQTAHIKYSNEVSEDMQIQRGVRQGCVLSPLLFNIYSEEIFSRALQNMDSIGILVNGERLNNIRFADDTAIFAENLEDLQTLISEISQISQEFGIDINNKKTKYMVISKDHIPNTQLRMGQNNIDKVANINYLGSTLNDKWDHSCEIKCRIEKARAAFIRMSKIFKARDLNIKTKIRLLKCYVFSVLLYGVESWTVTDASLRKLEAFEMWLYRRILRISWKEHVTNKRVLERMNKDLEIINTVKRRKLEYLGHIMRNTERYRLLQLVLQGKVMGKRGPGRRRISWLKNLRTWYSTTTTGLFRAAVNHITIARMIADIH